MTNPKKLRVALLIDSFIQPRWVFSALEELSRSSVAEIVATLTSSPIQHRSSSWLWQCYRWLDRCAFSPRESVDQKTDIRPLLKNLPIHSGQTTGEPRNLDVVLQLVEGPLQHDAAPATYGIWSYYFGDRISRIGDFLGFWEMLEEHPVILSGLQMWTPQEAKIIYQSWASTFPLSIAKNRENVLNKSSHFLFRKLKELQEEGLTNQFNSNPSRASTIAPITPRTRDLIRFILQRGRKILLKAWERLFYQDQWCIASQTVPAFSVIELPRQFKMIEASEDRYWGDPFLVENEGKRFLFVEEFFYRTQKAHIAVMELASTGIWGPSKVALEKPYHLSYPFIFKFQNTYFMIPETSSHGTIELYRCTRFPDQWTLEKVLMENVRAMDTTLVEISGTWWMFVNLWPKGSSSSDELHLFYSDSPLGVWKPHRHNPVISDIRHSRSAGYLIHSQGTLYRPAQDGTPAYGTAVSINKITSLSPEDYSEQEVSRLLPTWDPCISRTHTLNGVDDLLVVDGFRRRRRFF